MAAAAAFREFCGTEGVAGNGHASRAWKGNDEPERVFGGSRLESFPAHSKQVAFRDSLFARLLEAKSLWRKAKSQKRVANRVLLHDKYGRRISDLRISITDRCNYRCVYCRSGSNGPQFPEMPIADYLRTARIFVGLGITKVRLTGGEPLLRRGIVEMVSELSRMRTVEGQPLDIAITTNGHLLSELAQPLADAGLSRVTVSMDAVDHNEFARITRVPNGYERVLAGIRAAQRAGLGLVKVNCVLLRGFNDDQITAFGRFAREEGVVVRFIEFMPLEEDRVWSPEIVVTLDEIVRRMAEFMPLREIGHASSETARRYVFEDGVGEIGIIAPVSHPFCGHCSRIRVTSDGKIRTCLFSVREHDLAGLMAEGASDEEMVEFILQAVEHKEERHHIGEPGFVPASRTMVHIGG
jgi:cyclic pyranopterin phosphate synthase